MMILIDIIQSYAIKGMILLMIIHMSLTLQDYISEKNENAAITQELNQAAQTFSSDLRLIGYNFPSKLFATAQNNSIKFYGDMNNDGKLDSVSYYLTLVQSPRYTLFRSYDGAAGIPLCRNVTQFSLAYCDSAGIPISDLKKIKTVTATIQVQSDKYVNGTYPTGSWKATIQPPNLTGMYGW